MGCERLADVRTSMAGVEAQILGFLFTALPSLEKTMAVCFSVSALFLTSMSALYCAVSYIWLRAEWDPDNLHHFEEWVTGSLSLLIKWCAISVVAGTFFVISSTKTNDRDIQGCTAASWL